MSIISRSFLLRLRNVSDKSCRENQNTHFMFNNFFFFRKLCRLWDNLARNCRVGSPQMTIWRMRIACWIPKATNTHSVCVILIAFPLQQWLHERYSMLRYMCFASLVHKCIQIFYFLNRTFLLKKTVGFFERRHCTLYSMDSAKIQIE